MPRRGGQVPSEILCTMGKGTSLSGMNPSDKAKCVLGLYGKREDERRPKTTELKTLNVFEVVAS